MDRELRFRWVWILVTTLSSLYPANLAAATTVFRYSLFADLDTFPTNPDAGPEGNDARARSGLLYPSPLQRDGGSSRR